jgi:hypothetical protein
VFLEAAKYRLSLIFLGQNLIQKTEARSLATGAAFRSEHPEELRPVSRKLLQRAREQRRPSSGSQSVFDITD